MLAHAPIRVLMGLIAGILLFPGVARAAECTDTWVGPTGGDWQVAENWSAEYVPKSEDVACIPKEGTAKVTEGTHFAKLLQGEGRLTITGGSLGLLGSEEPSNIGSLHLSGGALRGSNELFVTSSLTADGGSMEGAGYTVIGAEATGVVEAPEEGEGPGLRLTEARSLTVHGTLGVSGEAGKLNVIETAFLGVVGEGQLTIKGPAGRISASGSAGLANSNRLTVEGTEGRLTLQDNATLLNSKTLKLNASKGGLTIQGNASLQNTDALTVEGSEGEIRLEGGSVENSGTLTVEALGGRIWGDEGAKVENSGTLTINGQGAGNGIVVGEGGEAPKLVNTGTLLKTAGTETTLVEFDVDNENLVKSESGRLAFNAGGNSGQEAPDYWTASEGAELIFTEGAFTLGESSFFLGSILAMESASVKAHKIAGEEAEVSIVDASFELTGAEEESSIDALNISGGDVDVIDKGRFNVLKEVYISEGGSLELGSTVAAAIHVLWQENGMTRIGADSSLSSETVGVVEGAMHVGDNCECSVSNVLQYGPAEITVGDETRLLGVKSLELNAGSFEAGSDVEIEATHIFIYNTTTVGDGAHISGEAIGQSSGTLAVGAHSTLVGTSEFYANDGEAEFGEGTSLTAGELDLGNESTTFGIGSTLTADDFYHKRGTVELEASGSVAVGGEMAMESTAVFGAGVGLEVNEFYVQERKAPTTVTLSEGVMLDADEASLNQGTLTGAGTLRARELFLGDATMSGTGLTEVTEKGGVGGATSCSEGGCEEVPQHAVIDGRKLVVHGFFTLGVSTLEMSNGALLENQGEFDASSETTGHGAQISIGESSAANPKIVNEGELNKEKGSGTTEVAVPLENDGTIHQLSGTLDIENRIGVPTSEKFGFRCNCGDPIEASSGNFSESQSDIAVSALGEDLDLTRAYSAQAAAEASAPGAFGYGWTSSFSDRLSVEEGGAVTAYFADGSTVPFAAGEGGFSAPAWSQDLLVGSPESGFTLTRPDQTEYRFSGAGRLEAITDRNGNETTLAYDEAGRLKAIADPAGRQIKLTYNPEGLLESAEDPMGHLVKYAYEGKDLKSVTLPGETSPRWQFEYDGSHRMTSMTDGRGGKTTNEYDSSSRVISQTDPAGRTLDFEYGGFHTTITNEATGAVTDEWFTSNNEPFQVTHGFGTVDASTSTFAYDAAGRLVTKTDGNGHATTYGYDAAGNRTSEENAAGEEREWTYNTTHDVLTETTPRGETTTIERDANGNPETVSRPAPESKTQTVSYEYGPHGEVESMTDPLGNAWSYEYDSHGDLKAEIDPEGDKRSWTYDEDSRAISVTSPRGNEEGAEAAKFTTSIERDAQGRPVKVTDPLGGTTERAYDADGNVESVTDPNGRKTKFSYNADNERTKVERPNGAVEETGYDGAGQVTSQTDGNKGKTTYVRNVLEQPVEVIDPLERKTVHTFDAAGNLKTKEDPDGRTTTYSYDNANRLKEVSYSDGVTPKATLGYDEDGNLISMVDGTGESSYEYDQLGRLTHSKDGHGETVAWEYNLADEPVGLTYPNGKSISRAYDKAGRLESVTDWLGHTTSFAYSKDSALGKTIFPSGTGNLDEYGYDHAGRMSAATMKKGTETLASLAYSRDPAGQVESLISKGLPGAEEESFGYDENERLKSAGAGSYEYDNANNLTKAPGTTNAYDKASQLESATAAAFAFDKEGERTKRTPSSGPATTYEYDQAGNLTAVERAEEGETPAISESFGYDGTGLLASRTIGLSTRQFVWDLTEWPSPLLSDGENSYLYGPGGLAVEQISSEEVPTYLHHDQLGSTRLLTNSAGEASGSSTFAPYGAVGGKSGAVSSPLSYAGQYTMGQSGLIYLRARFYDPATAQFMSRDPIENITRLAYGYARENPLARIDPSGLCGVSSVGDIFESINPISEENCAYQAANSVSGTVSSVSLPSAREAAEAEVGFFDGGTAGLTKYARNLLGIGNGGLALCGSAYDDFGVAGAATFSVLAPELGEGALQVASRFPRVSRWLVEHGDEATQIKDLAEEVIRHIVGK